MDNRFFSDRIPTQLRLVFLFVVLFFVAAYWLIFKSPVLAESSLREAIEWPKTDFTNAIVDLGEIQSGGPPKDGIPAIDSPEFITVSEARSWLVDDEPVIVLQINHIVRAYPLQIMIFHEIVNDKLDGIPVSITFCPLCNATMVFDRRVENEVLDFGTTGRLRKSDMVMYDRQTESWWQQFSGISIVGHHAGTTLQQFPSAIVGFDTFARAFPNGDVLSKATGYNRPYGKNPYRGYDRIGEMPFLLMDEADSRLPAMERVLAVRHKGIQRLYPFRLFKTHKIINDDILDLHIVIFAKDGTLSPLDASRIIHSRRIPSVTAWNRKLGNETFEFEKSKVDIVDTKSGSKWNMFGRAIKGPLQGKQLEQVDSGVHFAFAWLSFNPDSEIYTSPH